MSIIARLTRCRTRAEIDYPVSSPSKYKHTSSGVTLIELVISCAIISVFIIIMMNFLVDKYTENVQANLRATMLLQTQQSLDLLGRDLKHAANVEAANRWADPNSPTSPSDNFGWHSSNQVLVLAVPAVNASDQVLYQDAQAYISYKDNYIYYLKNGSLYRRTLAATQAGNDQTNTCPSAQANCPADSRLADNISSLSFSYFDRNDQTVSPTDARSVKIDLTVSKNIFGRQVTITESTRAVMRNE